MKALCFLISVFCATFANAQSVTVTSGEHEGFSRIVLTFARPTAWSLQRVEQGYVLSTPGTNSNFDLSQVYRRLSRERLSDIVNNPKSATLELMVACTCFALPFEFRPGIVVVDIKDGVAPDASEYELASNNIRQMPLSKPNADPADPINPAPAKWDADTQDLGDAISTAARLAPTPTAQFKETTLGDAVSLENSRAELLWQLSKGAAVGIVDITSTLGPSISEPITGSLANNMRIGAKPGIDPNTVKRQPSHMTGDGTRCISNDQLDILAWENAIDAPADYAKSTTGLVGEFDRPNLEKVEEAVKFYLAIGFGAEARMLLNAFQDARLDANIWRAMSHILDLEPAHNLAFGGMQSCETDAAMWAVMADLELPPLQQVAIPAVLRAFSALPLHLRRHLGPSLASRFLGRGDQVSARAIRDAILRAPGAPDTSLQMLEASIDLAKGEKASAEAILTPLAGNSGAAGIQATVSLIESQVDAGEEISRELATAAEALLHEAQGGEAEVALTRALSLAYASQNRFEDAFAQLDKAAQESAPIWDVLAARGSDTEILSHAVLEETPKVSVLTSETERMLSQRLLDLGFPDQAMLWLSNTLDINNEPSKESLLLAAEIEFSRSDYSASLAYIDALDESEGAALRAQVLAEMDFDGSIEQLEKSGQTEAATRAAIRQANWPQVDALAQGDVWQEAANLLVGPSGAEPKPTVLGPSPEGEFSNGDTPLLQSRNVLEESAAARSVIERLLSSEIGPSIEN